MNKEEAIQIVEARQKWAKGDDSQPQPNMIEVYEAIDLLLAEVKNNSRLDNVSGLPWVSANGEFRACLGYGFATITRYDKKWYLKTPKVSGFFDEPESAQECAYEHHKNYR